MLLESLIGYYLKKRDECSMVKLKATPLALAKNTAEECMQIYGANGYQSSSSISLVYRDAIAGVFAARSNEILRDIIAQKKFEFRKFLCSKQLRMNAPLLMFIRFRNLRWPAMKRVKE